MFKVRFLNGLKITGKDFNGRVIKVELAQRQRSAFGRGGGRGGGGGGPPGRGGKFFPYQKFFFHVFVMQCFFFFFFFSCSCYISK